jgi:hypothetical protein
MTCATFGAKPKPESGLLLSFRDYVGGAKVRGYSFGLTYEQWRELVLKDCWYCGDKPRDRKRKSRHHQRPCLSIPHNGIDRVNNEVGYEIANVVPCCKPCNLAKRDMTQAEFLDKARRIVALHPL